MKEHIGGQSAEIAKKYSANNVRRNVLFQSAEKYKRTADIGIKSFI